MEESFVIKFFSIQVEAIISWLNISKTKKIKNLKSVLISTTQLDSVRTQNLVKISLLIWLVESSMVCSVSRKLKLFRSSESSKFIYRWKRNSIFARTVGARNTWTNLNEVIIRGLLNWKTLLLFRCIVYATIREDVETNTNNWDIPSFLFPEYFTTQSCRNMLDEASCLV